MAEPVLISICIPAFKHPDFLKRLLDSISIQSFSNFEVILSDDSPDQEVERLAALYTAKFTLKYFHNKVPEGTPGNWNRAIQLAEGTWIKLMHDDDWFSDKDSLLQFVKGIELNPGSGFIFSAYKNIYLDSGASMEVFISQFRLRWLKQDPVTLFAQNGIGPPSTVMHKANSAISYDTEMRWLVDIDLYIRLISNGNPAYIASPLVNIGISEKQVTRNSYRQRSVEIPESFRILNKTGPRHLRNILIYDAWWRLMRNLNIKSEADLTQSGYKGAVPSVIISMIIWQKNISPKFLRIGLFSKSTMCLHYLLHRHQVN
ncbi:MAG: glycosyltransferase family 2 protein [Chitinophagales bacterium]